MRAIYTLFYLLIIVTSLSCSKFRRLQKKGTWEEKYQAALEYYEEEEYFKASQLLEEIRPIIRGTEYSEKAEFIYANSLFRQGQNILSSYHFQEFARTYSRSEFAEEAQFMYAYSLYKDSPIHNLDQSSTYEAINAMQLFLNKFPNSQFREEATNIIDDMQEKLEKKAYKNSKQYYDLQNYKSAIVAFDIFKDQFPDSDLVEEIEYLKIDAQYKLAVNSIFSKKKERFLEAIELYEEYLEDYPEGKYIKEAEQIFVKSQDELARYEKLISNSNF